MPPLTESPVTLIVCGWIADREKFKEYAALAVPIHERYGQRLVASYKPLLAMEGGPAPDVINLIEYPDEGTCKKALADPEYIKTALPIRKQAFSQLTITMARKR